jgi:hypothetical protein
MDKNTKHKDEENHCAEHVNASPVPAKKEPIAHEQPIGIVTAAQRKRYSSAGIVGAS